MLKREVIATGDLTRHRAVADYKARRKAVERGQKFMRKVREVSEKGGYIDWFDVTEELYRLINALEKTL